MEIGILSIALLAVWSLIYIIFKSLFDSDVYKTDDQGETVLDENGNKIVKFPKATVQLFIFAVYIILLFMFQIFASIIGYKEYAQSTTGIDNVDISSKILQIILYTLFPWMIMFGSLIALLKVYPGWKLPFANTIGYLIVKVLGIKTLANKLIITYDESGNSLEPDTDDDNFNRAIRTVKPIIQDPSLILQEVSSDNFDNFWKTLEEGKILKNEATYKANYNEPREKARGTLQQYVNIKENIAEYIWYILAGAYIASYVQRIVTDIDPPVSTDQLNDQYNDTVNQTNDEDSGKTYTDE
jgi:hypothetical protein